MFIRDAGCRRPDPVTCETEFAQNFTSSAPAVIMVALYLRPCTLRFANCRWRLIGLALPECLMNCPSVAQNMAER